MTVKLITNFREEPYYCANFEDAILVLRGLRNEHGKHITGVACFDGQYIDITPKPVAPASGYSEAQDDAEHAADMKEVRAVHTDYGALHRNYG